MTDGSNLRHRGPKNWLIASGIAVLVAMALGPALAGSASAAPVPAATVAPATSWAYGGQGNASSSVTVNGVNATWTASFGWTVIFTATNTSATTVQLEEQRTVGLDLTATLTARNVSATYVFHGTEADLAFVNLTDTATVYSNGTALPAIGITNESLAVNATVDQSLALDLFGHHHSGYLNVSGEAACSVGFAPALGILPLNLSGVSMWNSTATATPSATWAIHYQWADLGWNGSVRNGMGSITGNWSASGPVNLIGLKVHVDRLFSDHRDRTAVVLFVQGPVDDYDGFVLVPHGFDLFGGAPHGYDVDSFGSADVGAANGQTVYVSPGTRGPSITDADTAFSASSGAGTLAGQPAGGLTPAVGQSPGGVVQGEPMTVPSAQAESACLLHGCGGSAGAATSGLLGIALIALAVVAVVGTVAVIEWRAYSRRKASAGLVGGYGEAWTNGMPPAGAIPPGAMAPVPPAQPPEGPNQQP